MRCGKKKSFLRSQAGNMLLNAFVKLLPSSRLATSEEEEA